MTAHPSFGGSLTSSVSYPLSLIVINWFALMPPIALNFS